MRNLLLAGLFSIGLAGAALADASVAGDWRADLGDGVAIDMNVSPDGRWSSETRQSDKLVRQMRGSYRQKRDTQDSGTLVFTPNKSAGRRAHVETDTYRLSDNGSTLSLTSGGDTMVFQKKH